MDYNLITNIKDCYIDVPRLLYYSHIPTVIISLMVGLFVFIKNKDNSAARILFFLSIVFSAWSIFDIILWVEHNSSIIMFFWSLWGILFSLLFFLSFYFIFVFIRGVDINFYLKLILLLLFTPIALLTPTTYNLKKFEITSCGAIENQTFLNYIYSLAFITLICVLVFSLIEYRKTVKEFRAKIVLVALGTISFLVLFFLVTYIASIDSLSVNSAYSFTMEQYGYFGMPIFMGFLAYLIVRYKAFNIKLLGVQVLVFTLVILVGSQFFFIQDNASKILVGITLALSIIFGYILIKSVKAEVKQREELELANKEITQRKEQLQLMADSLAMANDKLRKLDNAKTEFISIASHQLRTPITAIRGFASLVLEGSYGELVEGVQGALEKIYISSERLVALIEDLLNVSRIESGRMTFAFEKSDIKKLLKELYDNFLLISKTKKFYFDLKLPDQPLPEIVMDYSKIRELVSNFIDNALKYTEKGGVTVRAEIVDSGVVIDENGFVIFGKKSEFGKVIRITVSDTGIGIPKEEIPYLFKKFSRGKDVSRLHVGGTGLGLYVGKAIAQAHHGQVWVESDGAGKGSRFIIELPIENTL